MASEEYRRSERLGNIILEGRERLSISGVSDVLNFDEQEILAETGEGTLLTTGQDLHVERLSLESGELIITGRIDSLEYVGERKQKGGLLSKLF